MRAFNNNACRWSGSYASQQSAGAAKLPGTTGEQDAEYETSGPGDDFSSDSDESDWQRRGPQRYHTNISLVDFYNDLHQSSSPPGPESSDDLAAMWTRTLMGVPKIAAKTQDEQHLPRKHASATPRNASGMSTGESADDISRADSSADNACLLHPHSPSTVHEQGPQARPRAGIKDGTDGNESGDGDEHQEDGSSVPVDLRSSRGHGLLPRLARRLWQRVPALPLAVANGVLAVESSRVWRAGAGGVGGGGGGGGYGGGSNAEARSDGNADVLYLVGGADERSVMDGVWRLDIVANCWRKVSTLPHPCTEHCALWFQGRLWVIGMRKP